MQRILTAMIVACGTFAAQGQDSGFGLGIMLGEPKGI
jgi:hypothetical protein